MSQIFRFRYIVVRGGDLFNHTIIVAPSCILSGLVLSEYLLPPCFLNRWRRQPCQARYECALKTNFWKQRLSFLSRANFRARGEGLRPLWGNRPFCVNVVGVL